MIETMRRGPADPLEDALDDIAVLAEDLSSACRLTLAELLGPALGYLEQRARLAAAYAEAGPVRLTPVSELLESISGAPGWIPPEQQHPQSSNPSKTMTAWHRSVSRLFCALPWDGPERAFVRERLLETLATPYTENKPVPAERMRRELLEAADGLDQRTVAEEFAETLALLAGSGVIEIAGGRLSLTPAGVWLVRERLRAYGVATPVKYDGGPGDLRELLLGLATYSEREAAEEFARWRGDRGPERAAREIVEAMRSGTPMEWRAGLRAMEFLGPEGVTAVRSLGDVKGLRALAHGWLQERGVASEFDVGAADIHWVTMETIIDMLDLGHEADCLWDLPIGPEQIPGMADSGHARVNEVLRALAESHGDPSVRATAAGLLERRAA